MDKRFCYVGSRVMFFLFVQKHRTILSTEFQHIFHTCQSDTNITNTHIHIHRERHTICLDDRAIQIEKSGILWKRKYIN